MRCVESLIPCGLVDEEGDLGTLTSKANVVADANADGLPDGTETVFLIGLLSTSA